MQETGARRDKRQPAVLVIIPAFNEERFIGSVVLEAEKFSEKIIVVDDGSTDRTAAIARAAGAKVLRHKTNLGKGVALNTGFRKARGLKCDAVVVLDADGQHSPQEIPHLVAPILAGTADIVIGSRYLDRRSRVPISRVFGHRFFNSLTGFASGVKVTDSQSGFRAFSAAAVKHLMFSSDKFSVESEMQFLAEQHGLRIVDVPVVIRYSDKPKRSILVQGLTVLAGILRLVSYRRPLIFFSVPGALILAIGLFWGVWVIEIYSRTHTLAVGYALISVLLSVVGALFFFNGLILYSIRGIIMEVRQDQQP